MYRKSFYKFIKGDAMAFHAGTQDGANAPMDIKVAGLNSGMNTQSVQSAPVDPNQDFLSTLLSGYVNTTSLATPLVKIKEGLDKFLELKNSKIKTVVLDRTQIINLKYSGIVFYDKQQSTKEGKAFDVTYFIVAIASSGRDSLTVKETVDKTQLVMQSKGQAGSEELYTFSEIIDDERYMPIAVEQVVRQDPDLNTENCTFTFMDGIVIPYNTDPLAVINTVAAQAINAIQSLYYSKQKIGLSLRRIQTTSGTNTGFRYNLQIVKEGVITDSLGNPIRADFTVTLDRKDMANRNNRSIHSGALDTQLVAVSGYITGLPVSVKEPTGVMGQAVDVLKIAPHIVITHIDTKIADISSVLLGVVCGGMVGENKQYIKVVLETMTPEKNPGLFSLITGSYMENNQPAPINIMDKSYTYEQRAVVLDQIFNWSPIISVDIHKNGDNYASLAPLAYMDKDVAAKILTEDFFQEGGDVPAYSKTQLPYVTWVAKDHERDGRDMELEFILQKTGGADKTALSMYLDCVVINSEVCYNNRIELLSQYIRNGKVDGTITRVTIAPDFMRRLIKGLRDSGVAIQYENFFTMPSSGFAMEMLKGFSGYVLDNGGASIMYSNQPTFGGNLNFNAFRQFNNTFR